MERRHKDRARIKQNNKMLKALIRHHKIVMTTLAGSGEEWSDLDDEGVYLHLKMMKQYNHLLQHR
jgi:hypothetical protein